MINQYEDERKPVFLEKLLFYSGNITLACKETGISRNMFYKWKRDDAEFYEDWEDTMRYLNEKTYFEEIV